jgi:hypothetical protein
MLIPTAITRPARTAGILVILSSFINVAVAQETPSRSATWEIRVPSGSFNPIGAQGLSLKTPM